MRVEVNCEGVPMQKNNETSFFTRIHSFIPISTQEKIWFEFPIYFKSEGNFFSLSLSPEDLKRSAQEVQRNLKQNEKKIGYNTVLNQTLKNLGFKGSISDYEKTHYPRLQEFMKENNLERFKNFVMYENPKISGNNIGFRRVTNRQIADKLFFSGKEIKKVFTGYNVDWSLYFDTHFSIVHKELATGEYNNLLKSEKTVDSYKEDPELRRTLLIATSSAASICSQSGFNFVGDLLVDPVYEKEFTATYYYQNGEKEKEEDSAVRQKWFKLFRQEFDVDRSTGWVNVIKFNNDVCFLSDGLGNYDFLFRNFRNTPSPSKLLEKYFNEKRIPKFFTDEYNTDFPLYFKDGFWLERDSHEAEKLYYADGDLSHYPGEEAILKKYHQTQRKQKTADKVFNGFKEVKELGLAVQDKPVTISEFNKFLESESSYLDERKKFEDNETMLDAANNDSPDRPAFVTYLDALAYAKWFEEKNKIPVRFLRIDEYKHIHPKNLIENIKGNRLIHGCLDAFDSKNNQISEWKQFDDFEWRNLYFRFNKNMKIEVNKDGVSFYKGTNFGEWLYEYQNDTASAISTGTSGTAFTFALSSYQNNTAAAISTGTLEGVYSDFYIERDFFPIESWGKYKICAIGFRLCYPINSDDNQNMKDRKDSTHTQERKQQRGIDSEMIDLIVNNGDSRHAGDGAKCYLISKKKLNELKIDAEMKERLAGVEVIISEDGKKVITVLHRFNRRKEKIRSRYLIKGA